VTTAKSRFALRAERALVDGILRPALVVVEDGRIADVLPYGDLGSLGLSVPVEDLSGVLLPGLVDSHVHMNEPGRTEWEGFETATAAAASGGVTTLVDMPLNCIPVTTSRTALETKLAAVKELLAVDVGFWGGVVPGNADELAAMSERGMLGAKCFLCHSGIEDFPASREEDLRIAMPILKDAGVPLLVHAELELTRTPAGPLVPGCNPGPPADAASYPPSVPNPSKDEAIAMVIRLCRETRCPVHVVHLSSGTALPMIRAAKDEGLPFTVETCPHYLCLSAEEVPRGATQYKCAPPIREAANRGLPWAGVRRGRDRSRDLRSLAVHSAPQEASDPERGGRGLLRRVGRHRVAVPGAPLGLVPRERPGARSPLRRSPHERGARTPGRAEPSQGSHRARARCRPLSVRPRRGLLGGGA